MATIKKTYKPKQVNQKKLLTYLNKINNKKNK
jgi:hypothetical protein